MPVLGERERKGRVAKPAEAITRAANGSDLPSRCRRARRSRRAMPQYEPEPAAGACGQRQPAHRRKINCRLVVIEFRNDGERGALQRFLHRPERIGRARHVEHDQAIHRKPEAVEPAPIGRARLQTHQRILDPHHLTLCQHRKRQRESPGSSRMQGNHRGKLMQRAKRKTSAERLVDERDAGAQHDSLRVSDSFNPCE